MGYNGAYVRKRLLEAVYTGSLAFGSFYSNLVSGVQAHGPGRVFLDTDNQRICLKRELGPLESEEVYEGFKKMERRRARLHRNGARERETASSGRFAKSV